MNSANILSQSQGTASDTLKLLVFPVGNLNAALGIDTVKKVINYSTILGSGLNHYGLVNLGDQEVTVIDLHQKLFNQPQDIGKENKKYILLAENSHQETFGILVTQSPELYDIKLSTIRELPSSYRRADTLQIASHVCVVKQEEADKTIFILDPDELITA